MATTFSAEELSAETGVSVDRILQEERIGNGCRAYGSFPGFREPCPGGAPAPRAT